MPPWPDRCARGLTTIVDGTHRQPGRRAAVRTIAARHGLPVVGVVLLVSEATCLANQHRRRRRVPPADIHVHNAALTAALPTLHTEGYDALLLLSEDAVARLTR